MQVSPLTKKKLNNFRRIKRGYWSFILLSLMLIMSLFAEFLINSKALVVKYQGDYFFPVVSRVYLGTEFGQTNASEADYRQLKLTFEQAAGDDFVLMPIVPWDPYEQDFSGDYPPNAPNAQSKHYLGTDIIGRDILARLVYGFRIAMGFALLAMAASYAIGVAVGCAMGFLGGKFDLFVQRFIEIWSMVPFLYVIMILVSIVQPSLLFCRHQCHVWLDGHYLVHEDHDL
ncbi:oligopeptide transport system permease protein OppC [Vibrio variabilis]|uniref:Oligopeptide transport system permease protein OppC n=1 Tax=Vibrio variabilis TaxID=990271 RepID=A0ABQ0JN61_9VIBR|nr:oligopeptide transport system permease protein OppC [Vibrio variabilis]